VLLAQLISIVTAAQESRSKKVIDHFPFLYLMHVLCQNKDQYLESVKIALHHDSMCVFLMEGLQVGGGAHTYQRTSHASEVKRVRCIMTITKETNTYIFHYALN
jgi:hypothetical protein